jgi:formylmethanofuran dehydrogenase subunit B
MEDIVCNGCSLLCDDVSAEIAGKSVSSLGFCKLGHAHLETVISHKVDSPEKAISKATKMLLEGDNLLLYGWLHTTNEAIAEGTKLAKTLKSQFATGADIGPLQDMANPLHSNKLDIDLEYVRNNAEFIVYWGSDPSESLHRHPSRFAVLPRGEKIPEGIESRKIAVVDVRQTETMKMANHRLILPVGVDADLLEMIVSELQGQSKFKDKVFGIPASELIGFVQGFQKSDCTVVFYGTGITNSGNQEANLEGLANLVKTLRDSGKEAYALPMFVHSNTMGAISASSKSHVPSTLQRIVTGKFDTVVIVGHDALAHLPGPAAKALAKTKLVYIGPPGGLTDKMAAVSIHATDTITANNGSMTRIDMNKIEFKKWKGSTDKDSITEVLSKLHSAVKQNKA